MSRTLATSLPLRRPRQLTLLSRERLASRSLNKESNLAWLTLVANLHFNSAKYLSQYVRGGLSGKTSLACCNLIAVETSAASSRPWPNSGMGSPTEFWTQDILESPNDADVCLLSDIMETGEHPPQSCLTAHSTSRLVERLTKYTGPANLLLRAIRTYLAGQETKPPNMELKLSQRSARNKAARA